MIEVVFLFFCPFWLFAPSNCNLCVLWQLPSLQAGSWHTGCLRARRTPSWTIHPSPQWYSAIHPLGRWASQRVSLSSHRTFIGFNFPLSHYCCIEIMWGCWLYCDLLWLKELNGSCDPVSSIQIKCTFFWLVIGVAAALIKWTVACSRQTIGTYDSVTLMCLEPDAAISI